MKQRQVKALSPNRLNFRSLLGAAGVLLLGACGPIYDTQYRFTPPESGQGVSCIYQCENSKLQCRQLEEYRADDCTRRAQYEAQRCEADIWRQKGRAPKWYECGSSSCSPEYDRCETQYRSCYQSCGGRVDAQTVCVANCDQIPPGSQPAQR